MSVTFAGEAASLRAGQSRRRASRSQLFLVLPLILVTIAAIWVAIQYHEAIWHHGQTWLIQTAFEGVLAIFIAFLPPLICLVQNVAKRRQLVRLKDLTGLPVQQTTFFRTALASTSAVEDSTIGSVYTLPMAVYFVTIAIGAVAFLIGFNSTELFNLPNLLLTGLYKAEDVASENLYQRQTFVVIGVAFFASYSYSLGMLLTRINTGDLYPISLYYYAVRVVMACISAAILRHTFGLFDNSYGTSAMIIASFAIGFAPDLFVLAAIRHGFQILKIWAVRDDPGTDTRPTGMPLLMIDDLSRDKVDHLNDIGVDSVQVLARQNPVLLLTRLPYELALLIDWIAQAQLYVIVRDEVMAKLRELYIRDIFDLRLRIAAPPDPAVCSALGLTADATCSLAKQIDADPTFLRLREVRMAMGEMVKHVVPAKDPAPGQTATA